MNPCYQCVEIRLPTIIERFSLTILLSKPLSLYGIRKHKGRILCNY